MDKANVLEKMQAERAKLDGLLATLSAEQMCQTTLENEWSVKDVLAHIAVWERRCVGWIQAGLRGEKPDKQSKGIPGKTLLRSTRRRSWRTGDAPSMMCRPTHAWLTSSCWNRCRRFRKMISRIHSASPGQMGAGLSPL